MPTGPRGSQPPPELPDRVQRLLSALVREYIEHGEPVSSQWLAGHAGYSISSATVRNVLARLEEQGYVRQPHTSAGRVPTDRGYRQYVEGLLSSRRPSARIPADVEARLRRANSVSDLLARASHELSRVTQHVGFAWSAAAERTLERIEFVPLDGSRILVIVVSRGGEVSHKAITFEGSVSRDELIQAANYLSQEFGGLTISEIRRRVLEQMEAERAIYDELFARAIRLARSSLTELPAADHVFVSGTPTLIEHGLSEDALPTLRALLSMIEEKDRLVRLLTAYMEGPGLTIVIGTEHLMPDLQHLSLILTTCADGPTAGVVGILGPTRMRYSRAIAAVDTVSHAMTRVLAS
ncbi:MAG TPA: heat-inducible transcriptional repressor HrcA [Vicinamibacterales bacterium]